MGGTSSSCVACNACLAGLLLNSDKPVHTRPAHRVLTTEPLSVCDFNLEQALRDLQDAACKFQRRPIVQAAKRAAGPSSQEQLVTASEVEAAALGFCPEGQTCKPSLERPEKQCSAVEEPTSIDSRLAEHSEAHAVPRSQESFKFKSCHPPRNVAKHQVRLTELEQTHIFSARTLSPEDVPQALQVFFDRVDRGRSGKITKTELQAALWDHPVSSTLLGVSRSRDDVQRFFSEAVLDADGRMCFDEFLAAHQHRRASGKAQLPRAMALFSALIGDFPTKLSPMQNTLPFGLEMYARGRFMYFLQEHPD